MQSRAITLELATVSGSSVNCQKQRFSGWRTLGKTLQLLWQVSPRKLSGLIFFTVLSSSLPICNILVSTALFGSLARAALGGRAFVAGSAWSLGTLIGLAAGLSLIGQALGRSRAAIESLYQLQLSQHIQHAIAAHASALDLASFEETGFYDRLQNATRDAPHRPLALVSQLCNLVSSLVMSCTMALTILLWCPWLLALVVLGSGLTVYAGLRSAAVRYRTSMQMTTDTRRVSYLASMLSSDRSAKDIRLLGLRPFCLDRLDALQKILYRMQHRLAFLELRMCFTFGALSSLVQPTGLAVIGFYAYVGKISIERFFLYVQAISQIESSISSVIMNAVQIYEHRLFLSNLFDFLSLRGRIETEDANQNLNFLAENMSGIKVQFINVSFRYPGSQTEVLRNLNFILESNKNVALIGQNGSGKTTLIKLLTGLYRPTSGKILINDVDMMEYSVHQLRKSMSVLCQDYLLYCFTLHENIALGDVERIAERKYVETAAQQSGLVSLASQLPHGYDTLLGRVFPDGVELSGGQRQLVAATRTLARDATLVILDEPTASLDVYAERRLMDTILNDLRRPGKTTLVISHDISIARAVDHVLILSDGSLCEQGTHTSLIGSGGVYSSMLREQLMNRPGEEKRILT